MDSNESPPPSKGTLLVSASANNAISTILPGLDQYRLQLYHYAMAERIRLAQQIHPHHNIVQSTPGHITLGTNYSTPLPLYPPGISYPRSLALSMALLHPQHQSVPEEPKPQHSYIGLIAMAILSSPEKKLVLSDIYQHILENYPYFRRRGPGWRNSIRHNLSLNDCFVKSGRSANGKGHYWAIHPANLEDFRRGDFRRRKAQRKVRRHMGLVVDEEPDSPSPPPLPASPLSTRMHGTPITIHSVPQIWTSQHHQQQSHIQQFPQNFTLQTLQQAAFQPPRKRQFDVASLLAPDNFESQRCQTDTRSSKSHKFSYSEDEQEHDREDEDVDIDVVAEPKQPLINTSLKLTNGQSVWRNPTVVSTSSQNLLPNHKHNHFQLKNYYASSNTDAETNI